MAPVSGQEVVALFCDEDVGGIRISGAQLIEVGLTLLLADENCLLITTDSLTDGATLDRTVQRPDEVFELLIWGEIWPSVYRHGRTA